MPRGDGHRGARPSRSSRPRRRRCVGGSRTRSNADRSICPKRPHSGDAHRSRIARSPVQNCRCPRHNAAGLRAKSNGGFLPGSGYAHHRRGLSRSSRPGCDRRVRRRGRGSNFHRASRRNRTHAADADRAGVARGPLEHGRPATHHRPRLRVQSNGRSVPLAGGILLRGHRSSTASQGREQNSQKNEC